MLDLLLKKLSERNATHDTKKKKEFEFILPHSKDGESFNKAIVHIDPSNVDAVEHT